MANWLTRLIPPSKSLGAKSPGTSLAVKAKAQLLAVKTPLNKAQVDKLPNATIVYGIAASALFVIALCFLVKGSWFTGFIILLPAICFLGFAMYFLKHAND